MEIKWAYSVPKELNYPDSNEDFFLSSDDKSVVVVSDGASESFDSKNWAQILCKNFVKTASPSVELNKSFLVEFFQSSREEFLSMYEGKNLSWSQQLAFERGNFATLSGVIEHDETVSILSIGDSVALWFDDQSGLESHFLKSSEEFEARPLLISSLQTDDNHFFSSDISKWTAIEIRKEYIKDNTIYLLTDAIAAYVFKLREQNKIEEIHSLLRLDQNALENWVSKTRADKNLKVDDTTIVMINFK